MKLQLFDSRNTCIDQEYCLPKDIDARALAARMSLKYHHVIVNSDAGWEQYEQGRKTEWSLHEGHEGI